MCACDKLKNRRQNRGHRGTTWCTNWRWKREPPLCSLRWSLSMLLRPLTPTSKALLDVRAKHSGAIHQIIFSSLPTSSPDNNTETHPAHGVCREGAGIHHHHPHDEDHHHHVTSTVLSDHMLCTDPQARSCILLVAQGLELCSVYCHGERIQSHHRRFWN